MYIYLYFIHISDLFISAAGMFVDLVGHMIIQTDLSVTKKQQFVAGVVDLLSHCNSQLKQHQNTNIYKYVQCDHCSVNELQTFVFIS